jgi:diaminopimelate decarboxylase
MFAYRNRALYCDGLALEALAEKHGTPLYVYSASLIRSRYRAFDGTFRGVAHTVCYSAKANPNLTILKLLARAGAGFDVVSGGELQRVRMAAPQRLKQTVFSGVGKTADEIDAALRAGILLFNIESEGELELLAARASKLKKRARVAARVNPDVSAQTHPYISTGLREHKFGVPAEDAARLYGVMAKERFLEAVAVGAHIGSQITAMEPFRAAMRRVAELVKELRAAGHKIRYVDAGGGLGIDYGPTDRPQTLPEQSEKAFQSRVHDYANAVIGPLRELNVHLLLEPGRALVGPAGLLLTRVLYRKQSGAKRFLITDAAMNDLLRPSLYGAYHEIIPLHEKAQATTATFDVVGPICETGDFFARDRFLPEAESGELLAILDTGAYGMSLASNYNTRPRPAEVLVDGKRATVIRRRESVEDLMRPEPRP